MATVKQNQPLTYALIGCGRVSIKHIKAVLKNPALQLIAIADMLPNAHEKLFSDAGLSSSTIKKLQKTVHFYTDYEELLEKEKPSITAITTPSGLHFQMAKNAILSGSHVLLEKPMTMISSEARELYALSQRENKKIAMGHIYRYFPVVGLLQEDIQKGVFGKISHGAVTVRWGHDQAYYDQAAWRGSWKSDGGVFMNQTVHALDLMCWLMGNPAVFATSFIARRFHDMQAEDIGLGVLELKDGSLCQIEGTTNTPQKRHEAAFQIFGSNGYASLGLRKGKPFFDIRDGNGKKQNFRYFSRQIKKTGWKTLPDFFNPHIGIYKDLVCAIQNDQAPIADALSGYASVDMILALYQSAKEGRKIELPLSEDFSTIEMTDFFESKA